ncbi:MAG: sigma-70 family RNA polymerase sigma factor [bacterium]
MTTVATQYPQAFVAIKPRKQREPVQVFSPEAWVDKHGDYLYNYAMQRLHDRELAEEMVQETFLAALKARHTFAQHSSERTWFVGILRHKIADHFRRLHRERPVADFEINPPDDELFHKSGEWVDHWTTEGAPREWTDDPSQVVEQKDFWEIFSRCLAQLPPRLAQAFTLREVEGLSSHEICDLLNITPNNLWVMLHRARARLRRSLEVNWFAHHA